MFECSRSSFNIQTFEHFNLSADRQAIERSLYVIARVAELADALDLGSSAFGYGGSTPPFRTTFISLD